MILLQIGKLFTEIIYHRTSQFRSVFNNLNLTSKTLTMNEIQKWLSESTFDADVRQWFGIFCDGYSTFKQIAKAYPQGSREFLGELKDKQDDKLIGNQRQAVGILFEKIEQSEQSGMSNKQKIKCGI